ncbi:hypothetical protein GCE9029_02804 [Grimontia celer]|uniref:eCIS core domain-containing protein n=1 Tax=Grimontia celer TaxID=1796497 RepID=A0A128F4N3_9GAMM|nr:DUF4157 domain-containing protein [Grimontia celer]CZF81747.1 hypothetical protein GCE9029_02804 [Grimontia celer]
MLFAPQKKVTPNSTPKKDAKSANILSRRGSELLSSNKKTTAEKALAVSECTGSSLRVLPGGNATKPMNMARVVRQFSNAKTPKHTAKVPTSVASSVRGFGHALLEAAQETKTEAAMEPSFPAGFNAAPLSSGSPIPEATRVHFESAYGYDLSPVRLHQGVREESALQALNTVAFTLNDHIVMDSRISLDSHAGRHVLGHELAHAVQGRLGSQSAHHQPRLSQPNWHSEREAESATKAALAGRRYDIRQAVDEDVHQVAPWLILAGIGLAAGLVTWAVSDSPEENRRRHAAGEEDASQSLWTLVPIYGSIQQIREAESYFQRVLGVGFLMLDMATLGSAGVAARALIRAPAALVRTAVTRQGSRLVVREGGEIATEAMAREVAEGFVREGGAVFATRSAATAEMMQALQRGAMLLVTEGGLNHAVMYARNAAGQLVRVHGGPLRVLFHEAPRALGQEAVESLGRRVNAYVVIEAGEAAVDIERATGIVQNSAPAIVRWLSGNPTSCGILQGALLEASELSATALSRLMPAGATSRLVPVTIMDHMIQSGAGLRLVEGGMANVIRGTAIQESMLVAGGALPAIVSGMVGFFVHMGTYSPEEQEALGRPGDPSGMEPAAPAAQPVPQQQIDTTVDVYIDVLSSADRTGHRRVVFTIRRTQSEISPGFEKLSEQSPLSEQGESMRPIMAIMVANIANEPIGEYQIIATRNMSGWGLVRGQ